MRIPFVSPYTNCTLPKSRQTGLPQQDKLRVIDYFNRLDEKQAIGKSMGNWMNQIEWQGINFGAISLNGLRIASRLLQVRVKQTAIRWTEQKPLLCCATARASYKSVTLAGAYSLPADADFAETIAGILAQRNAVRKVIPEWIIAKFLHMRKVYFAHPLTTFGTVTTTNALARIKKQAPDWVVIDPERTVTTTGGEAMRESLAQVRLCNALVFTSNGHRNISKGVFSEIECALEQKLPAFWLNSDSFIPVNSLARFRVHKLDFNHYASILTIR